MTDDAFFTYIMSQIERFCADCSGIRLRPYQLEAARAILDSVWSRRGLSFAIQFPRQSGKNELQAQLEAYLLALFCSSPLEIVKVSPSWKPQSAHAMRRLETALESNLLTRGRWRKEAGHIYRLGRASVIFFSGSPQAHVVGATASLLLECDEAQEVSPLKWDKDFGPMAAARNATQVFWGTAWTPATLLAREKAYGLQAERRDGRRRVFCLTARQVGAEVPDYANFVRGQVERLGRQHPLIKTQYFGEELESHGGMFPPARLALLQGAHAPQDEPLPGEKYALLLDVAGEDEDAAGFSPTGEVAPSISSQDALIGSAHGRSGASSARNATALTVVAINTGGLADENLKAPVYRSVFRRLWVGVPHHELYVQLKALALHWGAWYVVVDATGVGAGLASFLGRSLGLASTGGRVIPFLFTSLTKSKLGWDFMALVDSGRFKEYLAPLGSPPGEARRLQELFIRQASNCRYTAGPGPARRLQWGVPPTRRDPLTGGRLHDDLLLSTALCAVLDQLEWPSGDALSIVIAGGDPFDNLDW